MRRVFCPCFTSTAVESFSVTFCEKPFGFFSAAFSLSAAFFAASPALLVALRGLVRLLLAFCLDEPEKRLLASSRNFHFL